MNVMCTSHLSIHQSGLLSTTGGGSASSSTAIFSGTDCDGDSERDTRQESIISASGMITRALLTFLRATAAVSVRCWVPIGISVGRRRLHVADPSIDLSRALLLSVAIARAVFGSGIGFRQVEEAFPVSSRIFAEPFYLVDAANDRQGQKPRTVPSFRLVEAERGQHIVSSDRDDGIASEDGEPLEGAKVGCGI